MNSAVEQDIAEFLRSLDLGEIMSSQPVSGGSINDAFRLETTTGPYFLKVNCAVTFHQMFEAEARGLELLTRSSFRVPEPITTGTFGSKQFILMEWVEKGLPKAGFWDEFGQNLAGLHSMTSARFGLDDDNYIGSLPQSNTATSTWSEFYRDQRLIPQMKMADRSGRLTTKMQRGFDGLFAKFENVFPTENPALVHGDLWSGNLMVAENGSPCIFDPAVYYGHREMDLAMMSLFGGFGNAWVEAYNEVYPLESGWQERIPIGQLYPLMVHVNLFGGGYARSVESILQMFI